MNKQQIDKFYSKVDNDILSTMDDCLALSSKINDWLINKERYIALNKTVEV